MKPISHVNGLGRALLAAFGIRASSVAHDDLDATVLAQRRGEYLGVAIIQQIDGPMRLDIDWQRTRALLTLVSFVVNVVTI
jgi:hypothetical protein